MTCSMLEAQDEMASIFKAAWDAEGLSAEYPDSAFTMPTTRVPWARFLIQHVTGGSASLPRADGKILRNRIGFITIQVFTPNGNGLQESYRLGNMLLRTFETAKPNYGIMFRNIRPIEAGKDGDYQQLNVVVDFSYDEIN